MSRVPSFIEELNLSSVIVFLEIWKSSLQSLVIVLERLGESKEKYNDNFRF